MGARKKLALQVERSGDGGWTMTGLDGKDHKFESVSIGPPFPVCYDASKAEECRLDEFTKEVRLKYLKYLVEKRLIPDQTNPWCRTDTLAGTLFFDSEGNVCVVVPLEQVEKGGQP